LETTIVSEIEVLASQDGRIAVPAKILLETLKALPEQPITFILDGETNGITLKSSYGEYKLAGDTPDEFPQLPEEDNVDSIQLNTKILSEAIAKTIFATSSDELRQAMTGCRWRCKLELQ